ncbi:single-stranded DNA-binding protein [Streptosporangium sp. NPDC006930]|uniref:single-stranded DNA-binding protein n=1 Tax=unclassified Streptosporangium TaxID=2632669 RepID=UPI00341479CC
MNDIYVTLTGNVAAPPRQHTFPDGSRVTSLKIASTSRYYDRENQQWRNGETTYFGVRCFRGLADNVAQSVQMGQPVVVQGRLRIREFAHEGERRFMPEVEANSLGHDLRWGLGSFSKPQRGGPVAALGSAERIELDRETSDWAMSGGAPVAAGALGATSPLKTGSDAEPSTPREVEITPDGEATEAGAISAGSTAHPETTGPQDTTHVWEAVEAPPRPADHELTGQGHGPAREETAEGQAVTGRTKAARSTTTRRRGTTGARGPSVGEAPVGSGPGTMRIHPDTSDETPWPTRAPIAA